MSNDLYVVGLVDQITQRGGPEAFDVTINVIEVWRILTLFSEDNAQHARSLCLASLSPRGDLRGVSVHTSISVPSHLCFTPNMLRLALKLQRTRSVHYYRERECQLTRI